MYSDFEVRILITHANLDGTKCGGIAIEQALM